MLRETRGRRLLVADVQRALLGGDRVVVVVSAMGRAPDPYATDSLLELASEASSGDSGSAGALERHNLDLLLSAGETVATGLVALHLCAAGIPAVAFAASRAGLVTTRDFGRARIQRVEAGRLLDALETGRVPVVAGFQGVTEDGEITTLGRGGSDITAVAIGAALGARVVEIVKDVKGVMTADPWLVEDARLLPALSHDDLLAMSRLGSRVVHHLAVELARSYEVPLRVRELGHEGGTHVMTRSETLDLSEQASAVALAHHERMVLLTMRPARADGAVRLARLLATPRIGVPLHSVTITPLGLTACVHAAEVSTVVALAREDEDTIVEVRSSCAAVAIVGPAGETAFDLLAAVIARLEAIGVSVLHAQCAQGISLVVDAADLGPALVHLHELLRLDGAPAAEALTLKSLP